MRAKWRHKLCAETWQDGKIVHCKYFSLSHTKPQESFLRLCMGQREVLAEHEFSFLSWMRNANVRNHLTLFWLVYVWNYPKQIVKTGKSSWTRGRMGRTKWRRKCTQSPQRLIRGGSAPRSNPLSLSILAEKLPLLYTFYWKKVPLSHTYFGKSCSHFHVVLKK